MPITTSDPISVSNEIRIVIDTNEASKTVQTFAAIDTFGEVVNDVVIPGANEVAGDTTFTLKDFEYVVSLNDSLSSGFVLVTDEIVEVSEEVLVALSNGYGMSPVTTEEVSGSTRYVLTLIADSGAFATIQQRVLLEELLARLGNDSSDDITAQDAFEALIATANRLSGV